MHPVRYFGGWSPDTQSSVPTPVGEQCTHCIEKIRSGDAGVLMTHIEMINGVMAAIDKPIHRACFMRSVVGSVAHQFRECKCFSGKLDDPPGFSLCCRLGWKWVLRFLIGLGLTRKLAAEAALQLYESRRAKDHRAALN